MLNVLFKNDHLLIAQTYAYSKQYNSDYGFNLALHTSDNETSVLKNRSAFLTLLNQECHHKIHTLYWLNQIHGNQLFEPKSLFVTPPNADAIMSDEKGVGLCIMTADCVPIVLFDETKIANIHAGWQGLVKGVIQEAYNKFDCQTPIYAYIGACISGGCYEIPKTMANEIIQTCQSQFLLSDADIKTLITEKDDDKVWFAVGELAKLQLSALGVTLINDKVDCTYTGNYFSHRKATHEQKANTGRMAMVVARF